MARDRLPRADGAYSVSTACDAGTKPLRRAHRSSKPFHENAVARGKMPLACAALHRDGRVRVHDKKTEKSLAFVK